MKRDACAFMFVSNFLEYVSAKNWQNRMKSDKDITTTKRVKFFETDYFISIYDVHVSLTEILSCRSRYSLSIPLAAMVKFRKHY